MSGWSVRRSHGLASLNPDNTIADSPMDHLGRDGSPRGQIGLALGDRIKPAERRIRYLGGVIHVESIGGRRENCHRSFVRLAARATRRSPRRERLNLPADGTMCVAAVKEALCLIPHGCTTLASLSH